MDTFVSLNRTDFLQVGMDSLSDYAIAERTTDRTVPL